MNFGKETLLLNAPHPDDEILGCFSLIDCKGWKGASVSKKFLTNMSIGDVILGVDDQKIYAPKDISRVIDEGLHKVGDIVQLTILRENKTMDIQLVLEEPKSQWWGF